VTEREQHDTMYVGVSAYVHGPAACSGRETVSVSSSRVSTEKLHSYETTKKGVSNNSDAANSFVGLLFISEITSDATRCLCQ
jgi:hypothetical protein